mmetsp:Transcript_49884/g.156129  ORF Transcript_49884/g.156129 Transcript_49884/m.156129 type:complete len:208 (+) Transcript_49884:448-1071(+)
MTEESFQVLLDGRTMPLMKERTRLLREVGEGLQQYDGEAANLVKSAGKSATVLISKVLDLFPGFRDQTKYKEEEVFFYKRAQIFVGDVWGSLRGRGLGEFDDISSLTMFADYRVPQLLHAEGVLSYSDALVAKISAGQIIEAGSEEEVELRAWSVQAVEQLAQMLREDHGLPHVRSIQVDWILWEEGEQKHIEKLIAPHHRTWTTFY